MLPITGDYVEGKLVARANGVRMATPLLIVLLAIGGTDLLFALDSIPAVFGITQEPYIVFTANAFALLGCALFFLVKGLLDRLVYLSAGLALILVHRRQADPALGPRRSRPRLSHVPTPVSLAVIAVVLAVVSVASLIKTRRDPSTRAHSGSLRVRRTRPAESAENRPRRG